VNSGTKKNCSHRAFESTIYQHLCCNISRTLKKEMKGQLSSCDEDEYNELSRSAQYCWWRSAAKFDECVKLKYEIPNVSTLTPRLKVLREMERLALIAPEGLNEVRHKLQMYRSGDFWVPTGGISKEETDIPPTITILLVGFTGSGKSSLVNLMYSVLGRSGIIPFAQTSLGKPKPQDFFFFLIIYIYIYIYKL